ncbi:hypothetical protein CDEF62S_00964 [Castellaniella defragrans]
MRVLFFAFASVALAAGPVSSWAQGAEQVQTPHVQLVQTDDAHYPAAPAPVATPSRPWMTRTAIGPTTESLLEMQANGTQAGPLLPTLGAAAGLSYQRYLKSFTNPLPVTFDKAVEGTK